MTLLVHTLVTLLLLAGLVVFSYLDLLYRRLGRPVTGHERAHLEQYEAQVEPRLKLERPRAALLFGLLAQLWLVAVVLVTAHGVAVVVPGTGQATMETFFFLVVEVWAGMHLLPNILLARTAGRWLLPLVPLVRVLGWMVWPLEAAMGFSTSVAHLSEEEMSAAPEEGERLGALMEAATEEGILEHEEAQLIEQVVEFSDKRVREVMTPRPDVVAIPASASIEELRRVLVETKFSRLPAYEGSLDEVVGIVYARDVLQIPERDAARRTVRELMRPALFVPEAKLGSQLLKEMQQKSQQMAIVIDEYGLLAGVVTVEDLVEEIVGEIGEEDRPPAPDVLRESADTVVLRGSVSVERLEDLLGVQLQRGGVAAATTVAGLLNSVAGHVPAAGEILETDGLRFQVLEANQRKVLRVRARRAEPS